TDHGGRHRRRRPSHALARDDGVPTHRGRDPRQLRDHVPRRRGAAAAADHLDEDHGDRRGSRFRFAQQLLRARHRGLRDDAAGVSATAGVRDRRRRIVRVMDSMTVINCHEVRMLHRVPEVTADDGAVLGALDEIRRDLRHALARPRRWEGTLRRQARARAVRGSNSIEGIRVSGDEAFATVGGEEDQVSVDETWLAAKGYSDALTYLQIVAERSGPPLDEATLLALHFLMQGYDLLRPPGRYRGGGRFSPERDAGEWVEFALTAHYRQARTTQRRIWLSDRVAEMVDELIEQAEAPSRAASALELAFSGWGLRNATYRDLADVSAGTASRELGALVEAGVLQRHGAKKGSSYSPSNQHFEVILGLREDADAAFDVGVDPYRLVRRR